MLSAALFTHSQDNKGHDRRHLSSLSDLRVKSLRPRGSHRAEAELAPPTRSPTPALALGPFHT